MPTSRSLTGRRRSRSLYPLLACGLVGGLAAPAAWAADAGTQAGGAKASVAEQRAPGPSAPMGRVGLWTSVNQSHPNTSYWDRTGDVARVGKRSLGENRHLNGVWRSFITLGTEDLHRRKPIREARLLIRNTTSQSCAPYNVEIWDTGRVYRSTTWHEQPRWYHWLETKHPGSNGNCQNRLVSFDVTRSAKEAQKNRWPSMTLGLKASNTDSSNAYKTFAPSTARLVVN
ncbi:hypothetical protein ACH4GK_35395 [Streptomyces rimosus]|uniref:hypothetical protein n=1 Tax=Streptomyces rimosus TaxID=1927 RepID=UPI0004C82EB4|nr:hypothetical protein [Streptomyces rimosus]